MAEVELEQDAELKAQEAELKAQRERIAALDALIKAQAENKQVKELNQKMEKGLKLVTKIVNEQKMQNVDAKDRAELIALAD
jgi:hypothetical protein